MAITPTPPNDGIGMDDQAPVNTPPPPYENKPEPDKNDEDDCFSNSSLPISLMMLLSPRPHEDWNGQEWFGSLSLKCTDIPALMEDGLYVADANVQKERGYFKLSSAPSGQEGSPGHTRIWMLRSTAQETPRWTAKLDIGASTMKPLSNLKVEDLSADNVAKFFVYNDVIQLEIAMV
ncbi:uncharacterized protein E0L32_004996 [Thyridium curvatum]|uniref:Uncharacterized protein n=1 Tax=Thyridium curvatum TaxID=1093900 RepID=A0A507B552_9PEZI|nr:uncharacterized protein E0L32_004996 [Thyridium curvatum]TPX14887.1 hypothetical protein E0L32_004996 [Thyridium curvatum]